MVGEVAAWGKVWCARSIGWQTKKNWRCVCVYLNGHVVPSGGQKPAIAQFSADP
jgi:hypothetical protein